jgi:hypothetical protein
MSSGRVLQVPISRSTSPVQGPTRPHSPGNMQRILEETERKEILAALVGPSGTELHRSSRSESHVVYSGGVARLISSRYAPLC